MTPTGGNPVGVFFYAADSARRGVTDKFFERNLAGERGASALAARTIADLRVENERLRGELAAARDVDRVEPRREA
jgi:hypothetical protein